MSDKIIYLNWALSSWPAIKCWGSKRGKLVNFYEFQLHLHLIRYIFVSLTWNPVLSPLSPPPSTWPSRHRARRPGPHNTDRPAAGQKPYSCDWWTQCRRHAVAWESTLRLLIYVATKKTGPYRSSSDVWDGGPSLVREGEEAEERRKGEKRKRKLCWKILIDETNGWKFNVFVKKRISSFPCDSFLLSLWCLKSACCVALIPDAGGLRLDSFLKFEVGKE